MAVNGARITLGTYMRDLVPDGAGGAYLASATSGFFEDNEYFLHRFTASGAIARGWPPGGAVVCNAPETRLSLAMAPDAAGGAMLAWADHRDVANEDVFLQRVMADGTLPQGWPVNGLRVTDYSGIDDAPHLVPDGLGGVYLCWQRLFAEGDRVAVQRVTGAGSLAPGWPAGGRVIPSDITSYGSQISSDGSGGAIAAWYRTDGTVRALRFNLDGPVAIQLSLQSAEASVDRVRLIWLAIDAPSLRADVERRTGGGEWQVLSSLTPDGTGRLAYEDHDVTPGTRYAYRLAYMEQSVEQHTADTWVTVPRLELALEGFRPNPSAGEPTVAFVLADGAPAELEVYDVAGRRVAAREVGSLGPGRHVVALAGEGRLTAGVYALRLVQGERVLKARGVVVR